MLLGSIFSRFHVGTASLFALEGDSPVSSRGARARARAAMDLRCCACVCARLRTAGLVPGGGGGCAGARAGGGVSGTCAGGDVSGARRGGGVTLPLLRLLQPQTRLEHQPVHVVLLTLCLLQRFQSGADLVLHLHREVCNVAVGMK